MQLLSVALVALTFLTVILVSGNNLSVCVGPAVGSRIITKRLDIILGAVGFSAGLLIQGAAMTQSVNTLLPNVSAILRMEALLVAILVFSLAALIRVPLSLNMSLVGLLAGFSVAGGVNVNGGYLWQVALTWVAAPVVAFALAFGLIRFFNRGWPKNFWRRLQAYKVLLIVLSLTSAYVLGANTLGLVVAVGGFNAASVLAAVVGIFLGTFLLGKGAIRRVAQEFYLMRYTNAEATLVASTVLVEAATVLNIPLSNTQATSAAVFGAGFSYKTKFVSLKPFLTIAAGWVAAPLLSFVVGLFLG
ncbi:MAG: anion permease [Candidatus Bathyarchaeota archaeon]|nr:anion permease [Candidatus Bathyarchaeota archaeon]